MLGVDLVEISKIKNEHKEEIAKLEEKMDKFFKENPPDNEEAFLLNKLIKEGKTDAQYLSIISHHQSPEQIEKIVTSAMEKVRIIDRKGTVHHKSRVREDDFEDTGYTLEEMLTGEYGELNYDQPKLDLPTADDFDTSYYADLTSVLNSGHTTNTKEYFPHAPGSYTTPVFGSIELNRTVYENRIISDKRAISGNALFRNCVFEGIFYIGTTDGIGTNNVRFENCTFNGPVITGVPPKFGPEDWKKNALYFTGDTVFNNSELNEATILAPNYNVDIGNATADSVITGIVLGGVVDVRGDATIDGTIVSMADPLELGLMAGELDTNVGISDAGNRTIDINPSPERM